MSLQVLFVASVKLTLSSKFDITRTVDSQDWLQSTIMSGDLSLRLRLSLRSAFGLVRQHS